MSEQKEHAKIPQATKEQMKQIEASFVKSYGKSFNRMRKADLALMVANQSSNYKKIMEQAQYIAKIGIIMQNQRDIFRDQLRKRDGKTTFKKKKKGVVYDSDGKAKYK